jgi:hypothetical protein
VTTTVYDNPIGSILDNYADAIEGGNAYRGSGTAYTGIAGYRSFDPFMGETVTSSGNGTTTTVVSTTLAAGDALKLVHETSPPVFLLSKTQAALTGNVGAARRITAHNGTSTFTVAPAFPEATASTDTFQLREGFKRSPNTIDLEADDSAKAGWDRYFQLSAAAGSRLDYSGNGRYLFETELHLRLRLRKAAARREVLASALENMALLATVLSDGNLRDSDGTGYTQVLSAPDGTPETLADDDHKVVLLARYRLVYRVTSTRI